MPNDITTNTIYRNDGVPGTVASRMEGDRGSQRLMLEFDDGIRLVVPADLVTVDDDGNHRLDVNWTGNAGQRVDEMVIPVIEEQLIIAKEQVVRGKVRVNKFAEEVEQIVDLDTVTENVSVERVAINRLLEDEDLPLPREKDGVLIIPLIEEVQVVITQYMLREEVHISKQRRTTTTPEAVIVRREVVQIEREMPDGTIVTEHIAQSD